MDPMAPAPFTDPMEPAPSTPVGAPRPLRLCVFGSSSARTRASYLRESAALGQLLAHRGHVCINGAGRTGCMGAVNNAVKDAGGVSEGVIHEMWTKAGGNDQLSEAVSTLVVVGGDSLAERKRKLAETADGFLVLPGGPGTMDELFEAVVEVQLGLPKGRTQRPVCLVNVDGYWDAALQQLQRAEEDGMLYEKSTALIMHEATAQAALARIESRIEELMVTPSQAKVQC